MEPADPEKLQTFLKDLSKSQPNAKDFLHEHGKQFKDESPSTSSYHPATNCEDTRSVEEVEENVDHMLLQFEKKLFGDDPIDENEPEDEDIEKLATAVEEKWDKEGARPNLLNFRDQRSLLHEFNLSDPYLDPEDTFGPGTDLAGLKYLENSLKKFQFQPLLLSTDLYASEEDGNVREPCTVEESAETIVATEEDGNEREPCTVEELAETIVATEDDGNEREPCTVEELAEIIVATEEDGNEREPCTVEELAEIIVATEDDGNEREPCTVEELAEIIVATEEDGNEREPCTVEELAEIIVATEEDGNEREPCTVEELAEIIVATEKEVKENNKLPLNSPIESVNESSIGDVHDGETPSESGAGEEKANEQNKNSPKKKKKKQKKANEYEPKLVDIEWADPRSNPDFARELEDMMKCDSFNFVPKNYDIPVGLDDLAEEFSPPVLPRDIVKMLTTASEKDFADWEYSIQVEKNELSDSDESDVEDLFQQEKEFEIEIDEAIETNEELQAKIAQGCKVEGNLDVSDFMKLIIPPVLEDIIAVRDDMGNIATYESVLRQDEHLSKEYERVYLGMESESEDEDAEKEEDGDKGDEELEIGWEKDKVKGSGISQSEATEMTEEELNKSLKDIKDYIASYKNSFSNQEEFDPKLKDLMNKVDNLLDIMNVPKAGEVKIGNIEEIKKEEAEALKHIIKAHENKICPPGILEVEISTDSEEDAYFRDMSIAPREEGVSCDESIARPAQLRMKFETIPDLDVEQDGIDINAEPPPRSETSAKRDGTFIPPLFDDENDDQTENLSWFKNKPEALPDIFADTDSSDEDDDEWSDYQENMMDQAFKNEYFKKGGTVEGLGESEAEDENTLEPESLESFSKKFLTFPFISKHAGNFDLVRTRRLIAQEFPELRKEAFADLSKVSFHLDPTDESSSEAEGEIIFKPDPFEIEDFNERQPVKCSSCTEDETWLTADEDEESEFEPMTIPKQISDLTAKKDITGKRLRRKRKKGKNKRNADDESSNSDEEEKAGGRNVTAVWSPIDKFNKPSYEGVLRAMEHLHKLFVKPPQRFKRPKGMKAWLKGEYTPTKDEIRQWKKAYINHFGDISLLDRVITPEQQQQYDKFYQNLDEDFTRIDDFEETNPLMIFKNKLEELKKEKERREKADEIIASYEFYQIQDTPKGAEPKEPSQSRDSESLEKLSENVEMLTVTDAEGSAPTTSAQPEEGKAKPPNTPIIRLREVRPQLKKEEWAEELDCSVKSDLGANPAMKFSFELDGFQNQKKGELLMWCIEKYFKLCKNGSESEPKWTEIISIVCEIFARAIQALENGFNVFVSAHTSAGKTVVAEYAIAMSKRNRSKAVYTSPVKALSNQKYADFKRIFGSVGLITGDIQLNDNAECLIMTTEILRSMLYNSSEKIRDLEFVVFDEVHYINDPERGHVWEEVLILLPSQVQIVMLSATVPNTLEFANWVGRTKHRKVMVCATHHRPVPLNHYLYTGTGGPSPGNTYLLKSGDGPFNTLQYHHSLEVMKKLQETERQNKKKQQMKRMEEEREWKRKGFSGRPPIPPNEDRQLQFYKKEQTSWIALISFLVKKDWLPTVSFVFSRKKCDSFAEMLSTIDLTTKSEKSFIHKFIKSQVEKLDVVDQDLPQIQIMKRQLDKGIGVHHSGILPVMKEIVEVLFQEGKVKLLFATETFAMGVNMPARTVVFQAVRKFDGNETRLLQPAEYIQMAGRAGRRGKDNAGNVLILNKPSDVMPKHDLEFLLLGNPCKLISKFRLSYRMILNTLTVSGMLTVQNMMERSFCENNGQMKRKFVEKDLVEAEKVEKALKKSMEKAVDDMVVDELAKFYDLAIVFIEDWYRLRPTMISLLRLFKEMTPGRLIRICSGSLIQRTALLLEMEFVPEDPTRNSYKVMVMSQNNEFERTIAPDGHEMSQDELEIWYRMVALMAELPDELEILSGPNDYTIHTLKCHNIVGLYKETMKLPRNVFEDFLNFLKKNNQQFSRNKTCEAGDSIARFLYGYTGKYNIIEESEIHFDNFDLSCEIMNMRCTLEEIGKTKVSASSPLLMKAFRRAFRWKQALRKVQLLRHDLSAENMTLYPDFRSKMDLLMEKGYISNTEQVQMKGYMAARIGKYELIVCELLMENVLLDLSPEEVAALLSFLVYQSNSEDPVLDTYLPPGLQQAINKCKIIMSDVKELEKKYDIRDYEGSEISKLKFGLVPIMYSWAKQEPLKNIMEMPVEFDFQEGMLVRWIQQLLETLKEVESAARLMGDPGVPARLQEAGQSIKRGIVFAPSLYTTMI